MTVQQSTSQRSVAGRPGRIAGLFTAFLLFISFAGSPEAAHAGTTVYPGSVTARLVFNQATLWMSYSANATGWASTGQTCIHWTLTRVGDAVVDHGSKCGTGTVTTINHEVYCPLQGIYTMSATADGPGGSDTDQKQVIVTYVP
ncbi:MAG: hypothetical protein HYU55_05975 [Nocardioides sp.]|nr:hypothetical protein [Nocardioides sp.]